MILSQSILDDLTARAKASPRRRMNLDLRTTPEDRSQRMLNAIEPESVLPVHRHRTTSETVAILRGHLQEVIYDGSGEVVQIIDLVPGGAVPAISIPAGQWHTVRSLVSGTVLLECKDGPWEPLKDEDILKV